MSDSGSDVASSAGSIIEDASEPDTTSFNCLLCNHEWPSLETMFIHCEEAHKFPMRQTIKQVGSKLEDIGVIKLINYLRLQAQNGADPATITVSLDDLADDKYLVPAVPDDPVLTEIGDYLPESGDNIKSYEDYEALLSKNLPSDVEMRDAADSRDKSYFDSYKGNTIHREMIEDRVRTGAYRDFITKYSHVFAGKTVLDVGCGTGILSLFCARAGAKRVFAVDNSDIAIRAREIVRRNGYEGTVRVIQGRAEDFQVQQVIAGKVDVIVSEWMGYGLLFEGMLDSVLRARDIYLKPGGLMVPSHCTLRIAPISDREWIAECTGETFWNDVYGFDFGPMVAGGALNEREINVFDVPAKVVCGEVSTFSVLDIASIKVEELDFTSRFEVSLAKYVKEVDAFAIWFDTFFLENGSGTTVDLKEADALDWNSSGVAFSTGPFGTPTHWHQAVLLLAKEDREKSLKAGSSLKGTVTYRKRRKDVRGIEVEISWEGEGVEGPVSGSLKRSMA